MNKRILLGILFGGLVAIIALAGFGIFQMQNFKRKLEPALNESLAQISKKAPYFRTKLDYAPFECQGLVFIECKSPYVNIFVEGFKQEMFSSRDLTLSLKEIDFKSVTLGVSSQLQYGNFGDLQEYVQAFFPQDFQLDLTFKPQDSKSYTVRTELLLNAQNAQYIQDLTSLIDSPRVQEMGLFKHISSFAFLDEGAKIQNLEFSLVSKNLSDKLFQIMQSKYGASLNKQAYITLAKFLAGTFLEGFSSKSYYPQMQELTESFLQVVLWNANKMQVFITPKSQTQPYNFSTTNLDPTLDTLFSLYHFNIKLSK